MPPPAATQAAVGCELCDLLVAASANDKPPS